METLKEGGLWVDEDDQCYTCKHQSSCTTVQLFESGFATLSESVRIKACPFYEAVPVRTLKLIRD